MWLQNPTLVVGELKIKVKEEKTYNSQHNMHCLWVERHLRLKLNISTGNLVLLCCIWCMVYDIEN